MVGFWEYSESSGDDELESAHFLLAIEWLLGACPNKCIPAEPRPVRQRCCYPSMRAVHTRFWKLKVLAALLCSLQQRVTATSGWRCCMRGKCCMCPIPSAGVVLAVPDRDASTPDASPPKKKRKQAAAILLDLEADTPVRCPPPRLDRHSQRNDWTRTHRV